MILNCNVMDGDVSLGGRGSNKVQVFGWCLLRLRKGYG